MKLQYRDIAGKMNFRRILGEIMVQEKRQITDEQKAAVKKTFDELKKDFDKTGEERSFRIKFWNEVLDNILCNEEFNREEYSAYGLIGYDYTKLRGFKDGSSMQPRTADIVIRFAEILGLDQEDSRFLGEISCRKSQSKGVMSEAEKQPQEPEQKAGCRKKTITPKNFKLNDKVAELLARKKIQVPDEGIVRDR